MVSMSKTGLSLIIPTYNEEGIIEKALSEIALSLGPELANKTQVIIVDDGSDGLNNLVPLLSKKIGFQSLEVLRNSPPLGKGASIALGFKGAQGDVVGFMDVDLSTPPRYIPKAMEMLNSGGADVFIASRRGAGASVNRTQSLTKDFLGRLLSVLAHGIAFVGMRHYSDTQCGFKFFKNRTAKVLYKDLIAKDGLADLEILLRANLLGMNVVEYGVEWSDLRESKRKLSRILAGEIISIVRILVTYKLAPSQQRKKLKDRSESPLKKL